MTSCFRLLDVCDIKLKICINVDIVFHSYKTLVILAPVKKHQRHEALVHY